MRVRVFELRLLAAVLTAMWAVGGGLVLVAYRPGGPIDLLVGLASLAPVPVAAAALIWPPAVRGGRAFSLVVWLGIGAGLLLVPSIGGVLNQILGRGPQTLLPSLEAVYPWLLALAATSLFTGLGIARRILGGTALRRRRLTMGLAFAVAATAMIATVFGGAAAANDLALRDRSVASSRFGPSDPSLLPPACDAAIAAGATAQVALDLSGDADGHSVGSVHLHGERSRGSVRWTADVATDQVLGQFGFAATGQTAWQKAPREAWTRADLSLVGSRLVDISAIDIALAAGNRVTAEDRGLEFVEGARGRHCRIAVDGPTFLAAFPETAWIVGSETLHRWRGELDYWVFGDGELGQVAGFVSGDAGSIMPNGLQATVRVTLTATDRGSPVSIVAPVP